MGGINQWKALPLKIFIKKVINLQRDVTQAKRSLFEEPELREDFILRMKAIALEKSITV